MTNPLLDTSSLPRFDAIAPEHVVPAVKQVIAEHRARLDALLDAMDTPDIEALVTPVELMDHELGRVFSPVTHLQSVLGSPEWRAAYNAALPLLTEHGTEVSQNERLQRAYAAVNRNLPKDASPASRSAVEHALRDFHLAGVDLEQQAKDRFKQIMQALARAQADFEHHVQDASDAWSLHLDDEGELAGLPRQAVDRAAETARRKGLAGYVLTLDFPTYDAVMKHAESRELRARLYRGWVTRGSDQGDNPALDNSRNIETILALRHEAANLVGFPTYADYSLATKMADAPAQVIAFLRNLAQHSRAAAERELAALTRLAGAPL